jgi:hypothetical protein
MAKREDGIDILKESRYSDTLRGTHHRGGQIARAASTRVNCISLKCLKLAMADYRDSKLGIVSKHYATD